jgi:copper resistance protein B
MSMRTTSAAFIALCLAFNASAQDHSHHTMPAAKPATATTPVQGDQPTTPIPVLTDADRAAAAPPSATHPVHDNTVQHYVHFNRLEAFDGGLEWQGQAWIGTDTDKLWLRSEGERIEHRTEASDLEVLYGKPIARWWDVVAGIRHDFKPGASQDIAAIGVVGVAPYKFEVEATAYIGASGRTAARIEAEYELLLTNRLILQPLVEVNLNGKDDPERHIGSGLSTAEAGLRLRYEITRQFAPYIGVVYERAFGDTANMRDDASDTRFVAGFGIWF